MIDVVGNAVLTTQGSLITRTEKWVYFDGVGDLPAINPNVEFRA